MEVKGLACPASRPPVYKIAALIKLPDLGVEQGASPKKPAMLQCPADQPLCRAHADEHSAIEDQMLTSERYSIKVSFPNTWKRVVLLGVIMPPPSRAGPLFQKRAHFAGICRLRSSSALSAPRYGEQAGPGEV
mmetsp:Transcript_160215/g.509944  ORF Transcript_160215/g.509944 Transcript_160215/m.509944 type:complete len:133 (-) Transcript_160215:516-914(-)